MGRTKSLKQIIIHCDWPLGALPAFPAGRMGKEHCDWLANMVGLQFPQRQEARFSHVFDALERFSHRLPAREQTTQVTDKKSRLEVHPSQQTAFCDVSR